MLWKTRLAKDRAAKEMVDLLFASDVPDQERQLVDEAELDFGHYVGVIVGMNVFAVEYGFLSWAYDRGLPKEDVAEVLRQYYQGIRRRCNDGSDSGDMERFLFNAREGFFAAHDLATQEAQDGVISTAIQDLLHAYLVEFPEEGASDPLRELLWFAPLRIQVKVDQIGKILNRLA